METRKEQFENYADNILKAELLTTKIEELNTRCTDVNAKLEAAEEKNDEISTEFLSCMYNTLTEQRLELELEKNKIEKELIEFELNAVKAE